MATTAIPGIPNLADMIGLSDAAKLIRGKRGHCCLRSPLPLD